MVGVCAEGRICAHGEMRGGRICAKRRDLGGFVLGRDFFFVGGGGFVLIKKILSGFVHMGRWGGGICARRGNLCWEGGFWGGALCQEGTFFGGYLC